MRAAIQFIRDRFSGTRTQGLCGAEIGVAEGTHAGQILRALPIKQLFLVDTWKEYTQEGKQVSESARYSKVVKTLSVIEGVSILRGTSTDMAKLIDDGSLDFVYIDANHQYESVMEDIAVWIPKVRSGGTISGHDYCDVWPGVMQAVEESMEKFGLQLQHGHTPEEGWDDWWAIV